MGKKSEFPTQRKTEPLPNPMVSLPTDINRQPDRGPLLLAGSVVSSSHPKYTPIFRVKGAGENSNIVEVRGTPKRSTIPYSVRFGSGRIPWIPYYLRPHGIP